MAYNTSRACVLRMRKYLNDMRQARRTIGWPATQSMPASILARRIREALYAAQQHEEFADFHSLRDLYKISPGQGWVEARWTMPEAGEVIVPERKVIEEVNNTEGIVGACVQFAQTANELFFPKVVDLPEEKLLLLFKWATTQQPKWNIINHYEEGLTLTRRETNPEFFWRPE